MPAGFDQIGRHRQGPYENDMDRPAKRGVPFNSTHATGSTCTPSRGSPLTRAQPLIDPGLRALFSARQKKRLPRDLAVHLKATGSRNT